MNERREIPILSTLPSKRFHSCVLTSYSFDFNYFNHDILSSLTRAGVRNLCLFIDDTMLQQYLGNVSGFSAGAAKRYSVTSIVRKGAFHPKMYLFFGRDGEGFLIIGSGNLTASGHGSNQELWSAFHIDGPNDPKAPMFKQAWQYVKSFGEETNGIAQRKLEWIDIHTPWLTDIPELEINNGVEISQGIQAHFLTNGSNSIMRQLTTLVEGKVNNCTLISPFFDSKAAILYELENIYSEAKINVIVQPGTYSGDLARKEFHNIQFYDWDSIAPINKNRYLHAKLLHLQTDSSEYLLLGSANITAPALGTNRIEPINEEVCLLLTRNKGDWLTELGLKDQGNIIQQIDLSAVSLNISNEASNVSFNEYRLLALDKHGSYLDIYINKENIPKHINLILFDSWGEPVASLSIKNIEYKKDGNLFRLDYPATLEEALYGQLIDVNRKYISNKQIIHDITALLRTNPDRNLQRIEEMLGRIEFANADIVEVLGILDPDDLIQKKPRASGPRDENKNNQCHNSDGSGEVLEYEEFTKISPEAHIKGGFSILYGTHSIERVLETLRTVFEKLRIQDTDVSGQDEESDREILESSEGRADEKMPAPKPVSLQTISAFDNTQKSVIRFFNKYISILEKQRNKNHRPNVLDISMFTISLHLLLDLFNKPVNIIGKNDAEDEYEKIILTTNGDYFAESDYCRIVTEIIGKFTMLLINGIDDSDDKYVRHRIEKCKKIAYWHSLSCIANLVSCEDKSDGFIDYSEIWRWELGMNLRHFFSQQNAADKVVAREEIEHRLQLMHFDNQVQMQSLCINIWDKIENDYLRFQKQRQTKPKYYEVKQKIFSDSTGFAHIFYIEPTKLGSKITIARAGFPESETDIWDFEDGRKIIAEMSKFSIVDQ